MPRVLIKRLSRTNQILFGPGLLSTLGEVSACITSSSFDLLSISKGEQHRRQRKMLNPVFSITHMRHMLPIFYSTIRRVRIAHPVCIKPWSMLSQARDAMSLRVQSGPQELDVASWMGRAALELIGQGGLGYSFDPLVDDNKDEFAEALKLLLFVPTSFLCRTLR